ncbi:recombinase family protein [Limibacillus sp. MBR-115]|jgi:DNA invertase Pin-like site-specific DNA recombinase|uniref:recombinase family protein n=1 Tax=Limibacillus sp. MBR-115 TaxID=3156465 RepID=UPI00339B915D
MTRSRCAIYTRKSTEAGLEQDFNSLDAQREAAEAYIQSQTQEGWTALADRYDDGGLSGATLERPALRRLLADIETGKIDVIVVYKVDRLTRSLTDFAKLVETFELREVSFVSVTQQFNTTTSMGRLTLNVLLSFAQFEREVIGERIRDKIAASKAKGIWMGGLPPLGYDAKDRKLVVNAAEADTVRQIFEAYLKQGTVWRLKQSLERTGIVTKQRQNPDGQRTGGRPFSRGQLYRLLSNPLYRGKIAHKGDVHEGQHDPIVDDGLWNAVQSKLQMNTQGKSRLLAKHPSLLAGILFSESGAKLVASHATKGSRRYRYYIEQKYGKTSPNHGIARYSAPEVERAVTRGLIAWLSSPVDVAGALGLDSLSPHDLKRLGHGLDQLQTALVDHHRRLSLVPRLVARVTLSELAILLRINPLVLSEFTGFKTGTQHPFSVDLPCDLRKRGQTLTYRINTRADRQLSASADRQLLDAVAKAHQWWDNLISGQTPSLRQLAKSEGIDVSHASRLLRLAFLSPHLVRQILDGSQAPDLTIEHLTRRIDLPLDWSEQERLLA